MAAELPLESTVKLDESEVAAAATLRSTVDAADASELPVGSTDAIVRHSHAPAFTLCPNPFVGDLLERDRDDPPPTTAFVGELRSDQRHPVYAYHPYHTKVPPQIIRDLIEHYTKPGELVLDVFAGSGMTGVAAREASRDAVLVDLAPIACFVAGVNCSSHDVGAVTQAVRQAIEESRTHHGYLYVTEDVGVSHDVNYYVWTDVFECPECQHEFPFFPHAVEHDGKKVKTLKSFPCPSCDGELNVRRVERIITAEGRKKKQLAWVNAGSGRSRINRPPSQHDLQLADEIEASTPVDWFPTEQIDPAGYSAKLAQLGAKQITDVSRLLSSRNLHVFADLWARLDQIEDPGTRVAALSLLTSIYTVISERQGYFGGGGGMSGNLYMPIVRMEKNVYDVLERKLKKFAKAESAKPKGGSGRVRVSTQSATDIPQLPDSSVDYIYTDPPFGANIIYSEMNLLLEAWLGVRMNEAREAVIDETRRRGFHEYGDLMRTAFAECFRVLRPGRWITVEFHNTQASVWNLIQTSLGEAGFVVAQVSLLDKGSTTILADIRPAAAKFDLLISAYKPEAAATDTRTAASSVDEVWSWTTEYLSRLPVVVAEGDGLASIQDRTSHVLFDRMVAYYVRLGAPVPISSGDYLRGLTERYAERDGMYFTSNQVSDFDSERMRRGSPMPPQLFITDERSAVDWIRERLSSKPQDYQSLHPEFTRQVEWSSHEQQLELRELLEQNFLRYDGTGPVPSQIHSYLSTNFASLRNKDKSDGELCAKAAGRWYVPDPAKEGDIRKLRNRTLLKQFEEYRTSSSRRLKEFRAEAVRAGFKDAYERDDYASIVAVAEKLPDSVLLEDETLLMYYDVAQMRIGG